jgi:exopolysaccharide production protein ExoQ
MGTRLRAGVPGPGERLLAIVTIFLLAYSVPSLWLSEDNTDVPTGDSAVIIVFTALFAIALTRLVGHWGHVMRAITREPLLLAFVLFLMASTAWSTSPGATFRRSTALLLTTFFGYYLVVRFPLREIIRLTSITILVGTVMNYFWILAIPKYGVTQITTDVATNGDWSGIFTHKNALGRSGVVFAVVLVVAARLFPRRRVLYYAFALLNVVLIFGANSKTALVGFFLLMVLMALFTGLRGNRTIYGGVAFGLFGTAILAVAFVTTNLGPLSQSLGRDATLTGRTQLWTDVIHEIKNHPWFGYGWSGFWTGTMSGPSRYVLERNQWSPPDAHNAVLELLVNVGIIGTVLFCIVFFRGLVRAVGHVRRQPNILGLFPLVFLSFVLLQSITERGVVNRDLSWAFFVVAIVLAGRDRRAVEVAARPGGTTDAPDAVEAIDPRDAEVAVTAPDAAHPPTPRRSSFTVRSSPD